MSRSASAWGPRARWSAACCANWRAAATLRPTAAASSCGGGPRATGESAKENKFSSDGRTGSLDRRRAAAYGAAMVPMGDTAMTTRRFRLRTAAATTLLCAVRPLLGQPRDGAHAYPVRPVRLIVPFAAGAGPDVRARQLADKLAQQLGPPVIVENRAGAGGQIGMQQAAAAAPTATRW